MCWPRLCWLAGWLLLSNVRTCVEQQSASYILWPSGRSCESALRVSCVMLMLMLMLLRGRWLYGLTARALSGGSSLAPTCIVYHAHARKNTNTNALLHILYILLCCAQIYVYISSYVPENRVVYDFKTGRRTLVCGVSGRPESP